MRDIPQRNHESPLSKTAPLTGSNNMSNLARPPSKIPIAMAVPRTQPSYTEEETLDELSDTFQQLELDRDTNSSQTLILHDEHILHTTTTMNDNTLSQTFSGVGYKPIHVKMYVRSVEKIAVWVGKDKQDTEELYQLTFYNGLRGEARQWFDGLELGIQEDWGSLKKEFNKKFGLADTDKQQ